MTEFHAHDGWYFQRASNGNVIVTIRASVDPDAPGRQAINFTPGTWASIIAHVSADGDTAEKLAQALAFHGPAA